MKVKAQDKDFHTAQQSPLKFTKEKLCDYTLFCCYWMNEGRVIYEKAKTMKNISYKKKMNGLNINCFLQCYFKIPLPKCPPSTPLSPVPLLTRWNLQQKFSFFLAILGLEKKKLKSGCHLTKKQNFNYENCFRKFSLHVSLHVCTNFKKEKKIFSTFKLILHLQKN